MLVYIEVTTFSPPTMMALVAHYPKTLLPIPENTKVLEVLIIFHPNTS